MPSINHKYLRQHWPALLMGFITFTSSCLSASGDGDPTQLASALGILPTPRLWLKATAYESATLGVDPAACRTATSLVCTVVSGSTTRFSAEAALPPGATDVTLTGCIRQQPCQATISILGPTGILWQDSVAWTQSPQGLACVYLVPAITLTNVSQTNPCVLYRQTVEMDCLADWDLVFISGALGKNEGWQTRGISIVIDVEGKEYKVCGFSHDTGRDCCLIPRSVFPAGRHKLTLIFRYDGKGWIGLSKPLYLIQWRPKIVLGDAEE